MRACRRSTSALALNGLGVGTAVGAGKGADFTVGTRGAGATVVGWATGVTVVVVDAGRAGRAADGPMVATPNELMDAAFACKFSGHTISLKVQSPRREALLASPCRTGGTHRGDGQHCDNGGEGELHAVVQKVQKGNRVTNTVFALTDY